MTEFYFVTLKTVGSATILDMNEKSRFICFKDNKIAYDYASYISKHRAEYGKWPVVNLSVPMMRVEKSAERFKQDSDVYKSLLEITFKSRDDLDRLSIATGIEYFYCHRFEYEDVTSFRMSGQDVDAEVDEMVYRERLDYSLKNM
jgi:hypothetical protein